MKPYLLLLAITADRFADLAESDLASLLDQKNSENTTKATKVAYNVFREYLKEKKINEESLISPKEKLASDMRKFCAEGRKRNVELYTSFTSRDMFHSPEEEHICNEPSIEHSNTKQRVKNFYNCTFKF